MNPKFVNRFTRSLEVEQELYRTIHLTGMPMMAVLVILSLVLVIDIAASILFGLSYANMAVFAMAVIALLVVFYRYYAAVQAAKKRFAEDTNNKGEVTVTASLGDDMLVSESSDRAEPVRVPREKLRKAFVTKHYYMIYTDEKMVYVFKKGAVTVGDEAAFFPYLRELIDRNRRRRV